MARPALQLVRVLGPGWQSMDYTQIAARAQSLGQAARLTRALAAYMDETESATVADALEKLKELDVAA